MKSVGHVLFVLALVSTSVGCYPFKNEIKSPDYNAETNLNEQPEILSISATVIWDGEPTLGGNWVSHPQIESPERVLIKNTSNGKSIVGAIFQYTKSIKKGTAVISSDAARSLNISQNF